MADGSALVLGGRFEVGERIASGGMASVYHGTCVAPDDRLADRPLAIKILHDHLTENPSFVRMFRDEGTIAARFEHAHIVRVHDVAHDQGKHFIVMDRIDGANLSDVLLEYRKRRRKFPHDVAFEVLRQVLVALSYVHGFKGRAKRKLNIVHRDISPHNILIDTRNRVRLTDFGIARGKHRSDWTETGTVKGKLHYMSPEQARGKRVDARADLYALAVVAWEMFVGRPITDINDTQELQRAKISGAVNFNEKKFLSLSPELQAWISKSLSADPEQRHQSAQAMLADMDRIKESSRTKLKEDALAKALDILQSESIEGENQQELIEMPAPSRSFSAKRSTLPPPMMTPQKPLSEEFLRPVKQSAPEVGPSLRRSRRQIRKSSAMRPAEPKSAAVHRSEQIALEAAGLDTSEFDALVSPHQPETAKTTDGDMVSRVYAAEQSGLAFATLTAWLCGLIMITGTLMEVRNVDLELPNIEQAVFERMVAGIFGSQPEPNLPDLEAQTAQGSVTSKPARRSKSKHARRAPRIQVRNDRFLPRANDPKQPSEGQGHPAGTRSEHWTAKPRVKPVDGIKASGKNRSAKTKQSAHKARAKTKPKRKATQAKPASKSRSSAPKSTKAMR